MISESNPIDGVPCCYGLSLIEGFSPGIEDGIDPSVSVIHENVQLPILFLTDTLEQILHLLIIAMVHDHRDGLPAPVIDLFAGGLQGLFTSA